MTVIAHGLVQRANLPIPEALFATAAAIVLVVSFVALAALWPTPRLAREDWRPLPGGRALHRLLPLTRALGVVLLLAVIGSGLFGTENPLNNFATAFVFIVFWVGVAFASLFLGDVFAAFNPWQRDPVRGPPPVSRALGPLARRDRDPRASRGWSSPPAGARTRACSAVAVIGYTVVTLAAQAVYGTKDWHGEAFGVYFGLFARIGVFATRDRTVGVRRPLSGLADARPPARHRRAADGDDRDRHLRRAQRRAHLDRPRPARATPRTPPSASPSRWRSSARSTPSAPDDRAGYVHSLVPIALAYVAAHYLSYLAFEGQSIAYLASDPLGEGWNLFGTADRDDRLRLAEPERDLVPAGRLRRRRPRRRARPGARPRAGESRATSQAAVRSQQRMLVVMVGFTSLALWLLAAAQG